jgi:cytochrome c-type biogenesis protein
MEGNVTVWGALGGGLLSFLTPCVLPLVPVYFASLVGADLFEDKAKRNRFTVFFHALVFVIGFSVVYVLMGAAAGLLGFAIGPHLRLLHQIAGSVLILFGLFMLVALKVPALNFEKRFSPSTGRATGYVRSFIVGLVLPFAWTACTAPILAGILGLAAAEATAVRGAMLLAVYSLGLGLPFLAIGAAADSLLPVIKRVYRYTNLIYVVSGLLLLTVGVLILTNNLNTLTREVQFWIIWLFAVENILILLNKFGWLGKLW